MPCVYGAPKYVSQVSKWASKWTKDTGPLFFLFAALSKGTAIVWSPPRLIIPPTLFNKSVAPTSICLMASSILKGLQVISPASATCCTLNGSTS